ncbi:hypothetical protein [Streptomyces prasinopilosus]|nr:hypothetical protein [Streptomyces prasinopilosus]
MDIPAPLAGPLIAAAVIAWAYLITVDWVHPNAHRHDQENR